MSTIGKLKEVSVRELWRHEQLDFSNWLAEDENLEYLNDITGLTLIDAQKGVPVGSYRCDIVAKDETSGITVASQLPTAYALRALRRGLAVRSCRGDNES